MSKSHYAFATPMMKPRGSASAGAPMSASLASSPRPYPLSPRAARWVDRLPDTVRIDTVRKECPEVLDRIASQWDDPDELGRVFDELLFDSDSPRARLNPSFQALLEIAALRHHAAVDLRRWRMSAWDEAIEGF